MLKIAPYTESELRFAQDFPNLEASRIIGSISVEEVICSYCEQEMLVPTDNESKEITKKLYRYGLGGHKGYNDLIFCCSNCQDEYIEEEGIDRFTCTYCEEDIIGTYPYFKEIYSTPYEDKQEYHEVCENCLDYFDTFVCDWCEREISQTAGNGTNYYREVDNGIFGTLCLRCYEEYILENGLSIESFQNDKIAGMFFNSGNMEPISKGWTVVEGYDDFFIASGHSIEQYCNKAIELIKEGWLVVTGYESLSIVGDEGYVTMFKKRKE